MTAAVVVVTGAAQGIGRACAEEFVRLGHTVAALDRAWRADDPWVTGGADDVMTVTADLRDADAVTAAADGVRQRYGRVDVLVNNAAMRQRDLFGAGGVSTALDATDEQWRAMFDVNVFGTLTVIRQVVDTMVEAGSGAIVNIGSGGVVPVPRGDGVWVARSAGSQNQPYEASKAALLSMSLFLAAELHSTGVSVNVVFPGATATTGSREIQQARGRIGAPPYTLLDPRHVVPAVVALAASRGVELSDTGLAVDALSWNRHHGLGGEAEWRAQD